MRPCVGFRPMVPVKAAGMRIEPPASLPMDRRTTPAATAAAQPLLPPGVSDGFHGLRVMPKAGLSVMPFQLNSGARVLPSSTAPASASRCTNTVWAAAGSADVSAEPRRVGQPRTAANSLMATGMPSSGPSAAPWRQRSSDSRAPASVPARSSSAKALMIGSARSACSSALRATSMGETSPRRYSSRRRGQGFDAA